MFFFNEVLCQKLQKNIFLHVRYGYFNVYKFWKKITRKDIGKLYTISYFHLSICESVIPSTTRLLYKTLGRPSTGATPVYLETKQWAHFVEKFPATAKKPNPTKRCFL